MFDKIFTENDHFPGARSKTRSSLKSRRISFRGFQLQVFHFALYPNGKLGDENLGVLFQAFLPNSEFAILHYTQNRKLGVGNLGVFSEVYQNSDFFKLLKLRGFPTLSFPFCTTLKTENSEMENLGV